ncbi:putative mediator of RNA polymerase II transcription subunit 12 isoform X1 [Topomyia yanbarensis]|uniref:putative mediator of RNA polymerase II transcription subunit 12 isoform X1 n=1 Tax=Topomyia yanbarensis TaxID=2498891 RepID=UPI00273B9777|nr:putative mediator of RNA polymerase II transcription subunit 12 isoform X1 [Topomyia yanbarensis]
MSHEIMQQPVSIKSEPDWNDLLLPEPDTRQYALQQQQQMHYNQQLQQQHLPQQHPNHQQQMQQQSQQQQQMRNGNHPVGIQQQPQQQQISNDPVDNEPLDIIETIDSDDNDFAEAESLTLQQYKKDEKLCEYYRRMPVLYDKSHPHYKFQSKKEKAWRELGRLCEMNVDQCKKRMTYFRCRFTVERRIMKNGVNCSEWPLLEKLKFLNKHIKIRRPRAPNGDVDPDTDDESNPLHALRKRQMEESKDDLHAYLDLQQVAAAAAAQNPQAQLHYQAQQAKLHQQYPHAQHQGPPGFHPGQDMGLHHLQSPHTPGQQVHAAALHGNRENHHPAHMGANPMSASHGYRAGLSQPTPVESPIPASNVEVSYNVPKRQRLNYDNNMDEVASVSNFNINRTIKYQNNLEHAVSLDEHGAFGLYVGEILRKLPERLGSFTSLKIMQALHEAQIQSFDMVPGNSSNGKKASSPNSSPDSEERKSTDSNEDISKE